jgi:hypothetical protein
MAKAHDYTNADVVEVFLKDYGRYSGYCAKMTDGKEVRLRRVTSVINLLDKPALLQWAANEACDHVSQIWTPEQTYTQAQIEAILGDARYAHRNKKEEAAGWGTHAHAIIERFLKEGYWPEDHEWEDIPFEVANSLSLFADWWTAAGLEVLEVEKYVFDLAFHYGGTVDLLARDTTGALWLIDWKTGKGIYGSMIIQLAAYYNALCKAGHKMAGAKIVQIGKFDAAPQFYEPPLEELRSAWKTFASLSQMYDFVKANDAKLYKITKAHKEETERRLAQEKSDRQALAATALVGGAV